MWFRLRKHSDHIKKLYISLYVFQMANFPKYVKQILVWKSLYVKFDIWFAYETWMWLHIVIGNQSLLQSKLETKLQMKFAAL